jgi:hypothetical protein
VSTIFDIDTIVADETTINVGSVPTTITLQDSLTPMQVALTVNTSPEIVAVEIPGPQGPPGLQNVYVQTTDPAVQYSWGAAEANYIWIQT